MNHDSNLPVKMGIMYGAALGVVVISIGIVRYKTGMILRGDQTLSYVYWGIFATSVFAAVFRFKKLDPQSFSFSKTIKIGLLAGFVSGAMYTLYIIVLNNYIDTALSSRIIQFYAQLAVANPEMSEDLADSSKVMSMSSALRGLIYTLVCMTSGLAYSMVSTLVAKRLSMRPGSQ